MTASEGLHWIRQLRADGDSLAQATKRLVILLNECDQRLMRCIGEMQVNRKLSASVHDFLEQSCTDAESLLYIFKTSLDDWQKLLDFIRAGRYTFEDKIDGDAVAMHDWAATTVECENYRSLLSVIVGNLLLNCHFFTVDEIEFDLNPREVKGERDLEELFDFLRKLCQILNKQTVLTP